MCVYVCVIIFCFLIPLFRQVQSYVCCISSRFIINNTYTRGLHLRCAHVKRLHARARMSARSFKESFSFCAEMVLHVITWIFFFIFTFLFFSLFCLSTFRLVDIWAHFFYLFLLFLFFISFRSLARSLTRTHTHATRILIHCSCSISLSFSLFLTHDRRHRAPASMPFLYAYICLYILLFVSARLRIERNNDAREIEGSFVTYVL